VSISPDYIVIDDLEEKCMAWLLLFAASGLEIVMALALKAADGWRRPLPSVMGVIAALASVYLLTLALKDLPTGTAYSIWTGVGAVGVAAIGIAFHGDSTSVVRLLCMTCIVAGVVGLRMIEE
jgi:quaternary ammonium compound-resistance protein SugE